MARNSEKAMTALARWRRMKLEEERGPEERRPAFAGDCTNVKKAERWRMDVIREINKKIAQIQNPGLGEYKVRDLNDEINKLLKVKYHWECRIKELGGPDYKRFAPKTLDREGREVPGNRGYKYFGAAKDLPGVRELFEKSVPDQTKKSRAELSLNLNAEYHGYLDDDDGVLIPLEETDERKVLPERQNSLAEDIKANADDDDQDIYQVDEAADDDYFQSNIPAPPDDFTILPLSSDEPAFIAPVAVPSQKEIEEAIIERKKNDLLEKYASEALLQQSTDARTLMGYEKIDIPKTDESSAQK